MRQEEKPVETRKGLGRETDATRETETETGGVTETAQEIETGIVGGSPKMHSSTAPNPAAVPDYIHTLINLNKHGAIVSDIAEKLLNRGALKATGIPSCLRETFANSTENINSAWNPWPYHVLPCTYLSEMDRRILLFGNQVPFSSLPEFVVFFSTDTPSWGNMHKHSVRVQMCINVHNQRQRPA